MAPPPQTDDFDVACPPALREHEDRIVAQRRRAAGVAPEAPRVGFALSGGGIRSATFCLGVFQALAHRKLFGRIDYLSTVSGGGYFGSFLGRLFTRDYVQGIADAEAMLLGGTPAKTSPPPTEPAGCPTPPKVFQWLRENGRYLSPRGAGDLLLGLAVLMRNWAAVQVVLVTFVLMVLLGAQLLRAALEVAAPGPMAAVNDALVCHLPGGASLLWWSPYVPLVVAIFVLWGLPLGWAYWMRVPAVRVAGLRWSLKPWWGLAAALALALAGVLWLPQDYLILRVAAELLLAAGLLTAAWLWAAGRAARASAAARPQESDQSSRFTESFAQHWLSARLKTAMVWNGAALVFVLVDSLGQSVYAAFTGANSSLGAWVGAVAATVATAAAFARQIVVFFGGTGTAKRPSLSLSLVATGAAVVLMALVLTVISAFSHAIAWNFDAPARAPAALGRTEVPQLFMAKALRTTPDASGGGWTIRTERPPPPDSRCCSKTPPGSRRHVSDLLPPLAGWLVTLLLSVLFGRSWQFLNASSQHPLYAARLTRAYLGASNPCREGVRGAVTQVIPGDDLELAQYWPLPTAGGSTPYEKGAPLHLINVTINETRDGRSQIEQQDRKGVGMVLGPAGWSAGIRHHAVYTEQPGNAARPAVAIYPDAPPDASSGGPPYRVFEYRHGFAGERLSLGEWVGISGAAFSTGIGARTNLGLSLLAGFGNIRLGYWWNSGIDLGARPARRHGIGDRIGRFFTEAFHLQAFFLQEFLARFHGTARHHWYLSDGGHFENMGAYELVRRRLPVMVVIDAEEDAAYTFEGLANLVRKARLDFQAEITFLDEEALDRRVEPSLRRYFGPLASLRRGTWKKAAVPGPSTPEGDRERWELSAPDQAGYSLAHAALAEIRYDGRDEPQSWLLYIKPTLMGDEPADVLQYHVEHPPFPQETTGDQFFDEAQWESYRKLGEWIAERLFTPPVGEGEPGRFVPGLFGPRPAPQMRRRPAAGKRVAGTGRRRTSK